MCLEKYLALVPACIAVSGGKAEAQEIKVGVTDDFIGATSAVGGPYKLAAELYPDHLGGVPVKWIGLDLKPSVSWWAPLSTT